MGDTYSPRAKVQAVEKGTRDGFFDEPFLARGGRSKIYFSPNAATGHRNEIWEFAQRGKKGDGRTLSSSMYIPPDKTYSACKLPGEQRGAHARVGNMHFTIIVKITTAATQHANFSHANGLRERPVVPHEWCVVCISLFCASTFLCTVCNGNIYDSRWPRAYFTGGYLV